MMKPESRIRILAVLVVVTVMVSAIGLYAYSSMRSENSPVATLQLDSLVIESGTYYPWLWVNSTDDSLSIGNSCRLEIHFFNESTRERSYTIGTGGLFHVTNGTWSLMVQLDLQYLNPGTYNIDAYANCTFYKSSGDGSTSTAKNGRIQGNTSLPSERPLLPRVLGIELDYIDDNGTWHYRVELKDPDMDGDAVHFGVADKTGTLFYVPWTNSTDKSLVWVLEGYFELAVPFDFAFVFLKDKDGPHSEAHFTWSSY